jgi:hypothetical protein
MLSCKTADYAYVLAADSYGTSESTALGPPEDVCNPSDMSINRPMVFHWNRYDHHDSFDSVSARMIVGVDSDMTLDSTFYTTGWDWAYEGRDDYCAAIVPGTADDIDACSIDSTGEEEDSDHSDALYAETIGVE